jgi:hypothetical protein
MNDPLGSAMIRTKTDAEFDNIDLERLIRQRLEQHARYPDDVVRMSCDELEREAKVSNGVG